MDITEVFDELNVEYKTEGDKHCRPGWLQVECPWCGGYMHMGFNLSAGYFNCYACGSKPAGEVLQRLADIPWHQTKEILASIDRVSVKEVRPRGRLAMPNNLGELQLPHWNYLTKRGFDPAGIASMWGVRGIGISRTLGWRLFIPIIFHGETVSWTTRSISETNPHRYVSAKPDQETVPHKHLLYGEDFARNAVVIVEGPIDAWRIGPGAVATFGLAYSKQQVQRMLKFPVRVVCFDNSNDAQRRARKLADQLEVFPGETHVVRLDSKDPGEAGAEEVNCLRRLYLD